MTGVKRLACILLRAILKYSEIRKCYYADNLIVIPFLSFGTPNSGLGENVWGEIDPF